MPANTELLVYGAMTGELLTVARVVLLSTSYGCQWATVLGQAYQLACSMPQISLTGSELEQAKALTALTWKLLDLNCEF